MNSSREGREPQVYFTIRMPESLRGKLDRLAKKNERTPSAEVRRAIYAHLERERA